MDRGQNVRRVVVLVIEIVAWTGVAAVGLVMLTHAAGWNGTRLVATLQSLTPYGIPLVLAIAATGVWQRRDALATTGALVAVGAFVLSIPLVIPPGQPSPMANAAGVTVASVNLLFSNPVVGEVADDLFDIDPDVIVFTEFTREHRETLLAHPLADRYPHQINRDSRYAGGISVWSKFAIVENERPPTLSSTIDASLEGPDGMVRVIAVHPPTPIFDFGGWEHDLEEIRDTADEISDPVLVIGDFNASYWHPIFRDLLHVGLTDAHMAHGAGWSTSWPTDAFVPPFVRLDHALTGNGLVSTGVDDFRVPGSDHIALVVTVTPSG